MGEVVFSMEEDAYAHLFAYDPASGRLTRLTFGKWSDANPALAPDGRSLVFASNRDGYWDIYRLDLVTGQIWQITNTPAYDGAPTWSPDMAWIAYETYLDGHLEIAVQSMTDSSQAPVLLTDDGGSNHSPAWDPNGRLIAYVSDSTGNSDIWIADLNKTHDRLTDLTNTPEGSENHPVWSPDGSHLAWSSTIASSGYDGIYVWDAAKPAQPAIWIGDGDWPAWNADGTAIVSSAAAPNQQLLVAYNTDGRPILLPSPLPGRLHGLIWPRSPLPDPLAEVFRTAAAQTPEAISAPFASQDPAVPSQRWYVAPLQNVQAPYPQLHAQVAGSFEQLRERVIAEAGWDALASLENAYVPLTVALDPGLGEDWLYTGRAFAINSLMVNAGWMSVAREDIGSQTYWRIYLRAQNQDGSQGAPIEDPPWDLNERYQLDPKAYEAGGGYAAVPPGYWIDFTALAQAYGWRRLPALTNWRSYFPGARFTEFYRDDGLDWYSAMLQLYPSEALLTPTAVLPPTATPTKTPIPTRTLAPTQTPRPTATPSPTRTPVLPTNTPGPSATPPTIVPTFPTSTP